MTNQQPRHARPGQVLLNRFRLSEPLGQGGMGEVWRAHDQDLGIDIALKLLHPQLAAAPAQVEFLKNECRLARSLTHPHIVQVYDFHRDGPTVFISMAWVDGTCFDRWIESVERPWVHRLRPLLPAVQALDYVHQKGLVHRDIKSSNILMDRKERPHLTDFGIAGVYRIDAGRSRRHSGGSRHSMSPQQRQGLPPHPADDVYSLGILLWETLTRTEAGVDPRSEDERRQTLAYSTDAPRDLIDLIVRMLAERREDRPIKLAVLAATLESILAGQDRRTIPPAEPKPDAAHTPRPPEAPVVTPVPFDEPEIRDMAKKAPRSWDLPVMLGLAMLVLLAGGFWLLNHLARNPLITEPPAVSRPVAPPQEKLPGTPPPPVVSPGGNESTAEKALADWRQALSDLVAIGASAWAPDDFAMISAKAKAGDEAFLQADYRGAIQSYETAVKEARRLEATAPDVLARLLEEGRQALDQSDGTVSAEKFALALNIEPQNPVALKGQVRAQNIGEVMSRMEAGQSHETAGNLALALADYEAALALDPEWEPAQAAVPRLRKEVARDQFGAHMSAGLAAFHRKAYAEARREINKALAFRPKSPEALEALSQIDTAVRNDRIARLRRQGQSAEAKEAWSQALDHYQQVLGIDPTIQFALLGMSRAEKRLQMEKRVQYYLDHPDDLSRDAYLDKAAELVSEMRSISPQGSRLKSQIATLERMVQNARVPVAIALTSDELTEVTIYRVGRLGRFRSHQLELRPGTYTIMGTRDGYRDVRQTIRIRPGQGPVQVSVQCTEKI